MTYTVKQGDVLEVTRGYPDNHFDGLFCDPPYGLEFMGKEWDTFKVGRAKKYKRGGALNHTDFKNFGILPSHVNRPAKRCAKCGKQAWSGSPCKCEQPEWIIDNSPLLTYQKFMTEWAKETLRVLKPGAWGLVFGGTRTWHRLACALEDAGFEIRDTLMWLYGSGFPKSFDISKGIDKKPNAVRAMEFREKLNKERERQGVSINTINRIFGFATTGSGVAHHWFVHPTQPTIPTQSQYKKLKEILGLDDSWDELYIEAEREVVGRDKNWGKRGIVSLTGYKEFDITAPATSEAKRWQGYGTALKPSWEPVLLVRKSLDGNNVQNALKHGCGGLNVDGGRIPTNGKPKTNGGCVRATSIWGVGNEGRNIDAYPQGRWPANLILDEESAVMLDAQSGELQSGDIKPHKQLRPTWKFSCAEVTGSYKGDSGGASRFYYCAKASPAERNAGAMEFYWEKDKTRPSGHKQISRERWEWLGEEEERIYKETGKRVSLRARANIHTTVKPLDLCRYLATLILPPERSQNESARTQKGNTRKLIVPFCGSGSEMIGGLQAGWDEVDGIDIEADYCKIAIARLTYWCKREKEKIPF